MALEKRTTLNQIEITESGTIQVRIAKRVVDGDQVFSSEWHRTVFEPTTDIDAQVAAVNAHLAQMGWPEINAADVNKIKDHAGVAHTEEVKAAFVARQEAAAVALQAQQAAVSANVQPTQPEVAPVAPEPPILTVQNVQGLPVNPAAGQ